MENQADKSKHNAMKSDKEDINKVPDSLLYPPSEDIYNKFHKESDINPEDISKKKIPVEIDNVTEFNEKDFEDDVSGGDLDIPGSELDNDEENIGSEDEENNYYSIGGDNHSDLDENDGIKS
ncbi:hypothetical protein H4V97_003048 [Flavobacterium sp. CG_23.5]|uniref:hypothetical protein n=1 Tax=unclassified Flavobacterium TaxID=196869 RepID=UPI0018C9C4F1|nr:MULTISPECIES: hypothetical protein [unclassified Flavobacterium]MBG6109696.1 hypothetical protein [Flavobacterium sp. CG_9.10]MBP2284730.1 hypothetical protein [Flavobacterium sp. CG_23.5]